MDWGHLAADNVTFKTDQKYDLVDEFLPGPPPRPHAAASAGAPGTPSAQPKHSIRQPACAEAACGAPGAFSSVEEAQAFLAQHQQGKKHKKGKHKDKDGKRDKHKGKQKGKDKDKKKRSKGS